MLESVIVYSLSFLLTCMMLHTLQKLNICLKVSLLNKNRKYKVKFNLLVSSLVFFPVILISAFRFQVGTDYETYAEFFRVQSIYPVAATKYTGVEYVFRVLTKCISYFSIENKVYFGILAILIFYFIYIFIQKQKESMEITYFCFFYLCIYCGMSFNIIRQTIAISICVYAINYYIEKKWVFYTLLVIVASAFHLSALFLLPCYFLQYLDIGRWRRLLRKLFIIGIIIFAFYYKQILNLLTVYAGYITFERMHYSAILYLFDKIIFAFPLLFMYKKIDYKYKKLIYLVIVDIILVIPMFYIEYFYRFSYYFLAVYGMIVANYLKKEQKKRNYKYIKIYYIACLLIYFSIHYIYLNNHGMFPYTIQNRI